MSAIRLNLGCGGRPLHEYINVDMDSAEDLAKRYPGQDFSGFEIKPYDIFALPFADGTVSEIRADSLIEHLPFKDEPRFFREVKRALKPGGVFVFSTPDFEETVREWLKAKDEWKDFYRDDPEAIRTQHWFGNFSYSRENRWGYLMAMIFGSQNGAGQFHTNAYTEGKIRAMMKHLGFEIVSLERDRWKGDRDLMLNVRARKF